MLIENLFVLHFCLRLLPLYGSLMNIGPDMCTPIRWIKTVHLGMVKIAKQTEIMSLDSCKAKNFADGH